jgi:hypothetical protein
VQSLLIQSSGAHPPDELYHLIVKEAYDKSKNYVHSRTSGELIFFSGENNSIGDIEEPFIDISDCDEFFIASGVDAVFFLILDDDFTSDGASTRLGGDARSATDPNETG